MMGEKSGQKNKQTIGQNIGKEIRQQDWTKKLAEKKKPAQRNLTKNRRTTSDRKIGQTNGGHKKQKKI